MSVREIYPANMPVPHIRLGNSFQVIIHLRENDLPEDFTTAFSRNLSLRNERGRIIIPSELDWQQGRVVFWVRGETCREVGAYTAEITYLKTEDNRTIHRAWDGLAFVLVEHTIQQRYPHNCKGNVEVPAVEVNGIVIQYGQSAYQSYLLGGGDPSLSEKDFNKKLSEVINLVEQVEKNTADIAKEIARAKVAEQTLAGQISQEISRATQMENSLNTKITDETVRAQGVEQTLSSATSANATAIANEVTRATQAETTLGSRITSEVNRATEAESSLQSSVTANASSIAEVQVDLVEVRDIAEGAGRALAFDSTAQLDDWLAGTYIRPDGKLPADLKIGDNFYILAEGEPDYWWNGTSYSTLETAKVDLSDYYDKSQSEILFSKQTDLEAETARATQAEGLLSTEIDDEAQRAKQAEDENANAITSEIDRAEQAEQELSEQITELDDSLSLVAKSGSYADLLNIPPVPEPDVNRVTEMFTAMQEGKVFSAFMYATDSAGGREIEIFTELDPTSDTPLELVPEFGFGPERTWPQTIRGRTAARDDGGTLISDANGNPTPAAAAQDFDVDVEAEVASVDADGNPILDANGDPTPAAQGLVIIPAGCPGGVIRYKVGAGSSAGLSYWIDRQGVYHRFHAATTPIEGFVLNANGDATIEGATVNQWDILEVHFGDSYSPTTALPDNFLFLFRAIKRLGLTPFGNVTSVGNGVINFCEALESLDISMMKLATMGQSCFSALRSITELKSDFSNLTGFPFAAFAGNTSLPLLDFSTLNAGAVYFNDACFQDFRGEIQLGSSDWSNKTISGGAFHGLSATGTIYADTAAVATAFKVKLPGAAGWTVVLNP